MEADSVKSVAVHVDLTYKGSEDVGLNLPPLTAYLTRGFFVRMSTRSSIDAQHDSDDNPHYHYLHSVPMLSICWSHTYLVYNDANFNASIIMIERWRLVYGMCGVYDACV